MIQRATLNVCIFSIENCNVIFKLINTNRVIEIVNTEIKF